MQFLSCNVTAKLLRFHSLPANDHSTKWHLKQSETRVRLKRISKDLNGTDGI